MYVMLLWWGLVHSPQRWAHNQKWTEGKWEWFATLDVDLAAKATEYFIKINSRRTVTSQGWLAQGIMLLPR